MKLLASLIATAAMTLSALVAVPSTATASGSYPGTVPTHCDYVVPGKIKKKRSLHVAYRVRASGNAKPWGTVVFKVYRVKNSGLDQIRTYSNGYHDNRYKHRSLGSYQQKGRYATKMSFVPKRGSVYKPCSSGYRFFDVTKSKKHKKHKKHH